MKTDWESAQQALLNARQALKQGDRQTARRSAEVAAALCPNLEEPWLILAGVASPRASVSYLERALRINPQSEVARKGMHWAVSRLRKETGHRKYAIPAMQRMDWGGDTRPSAAVASATWPGGGGILSTPGFQSAPSSTVYVFKSLAKYRWSFLTLFALLVFFTMAWAFWPGNASPVGAFLHAPQSMPQVYAAPIMVDKPTYTPTYTPTFTPTETFTPTPTYTLTPTPTATLIPTSTFPPTRTPRPTEVPVTNPGDGGERWIDVNLSQQMLYAYEGDTVVASFLVSTGVPAWPTVTGQYHIYIKLVSTLMAGYGYYLPDVPYTMYFYKGYGLHGTYWHNNFGHPMSHGCVNMYTPDAEWLFYWASVGTLVNIHY